MISINCNRLDDLVAEKARRNQLDANQANETSGRLGRITAPEGVAHKVETWARKNGVGNVGLIQIALNRLGVTKEKGGSVLVEIKQWFRVVEGVARIAQSSSLNREHLRF